MYITVNTGATAMTTATSRTFKSGNSEAVRLPKEVAFGTGVELTIVRSGDVVTMYPTRTSFQVMLDKLRTLPAPSEVEVRDSDIFPDRPGL
jgi:antitoxin VapB